MGEEKKYSYNELENIESDIEHVLSLIEEDNTFDMSLIFKLRTNMKKIKDAKEIIEDQFEDSNVEKYVEFLKEQILLSKQFDGEVNNEGGNVKIENFNELLKNEEFVESFQNLTEDYEDVLRNRKEVVKKNNGLKQKRIADIEWKHIPLSSLPSEVSDKDEFPLSFVEFVYDDE